MLLEQNLKDPQACVYVLFDEMENYSLPQNGIGGRNYYSEIILITPRSVFVCVLFHCVHICTIYTSSTTCGAKGAQREMRKIACEPTTNLTLVLNNCSIMSLFRSKYQAWVQFFSELFYFQFSSNFQASEY